MAWQQSLLKSVNPLETVALTTTAQLIYTAPAYNSNTTTPSATAKIIEIILTNTTTGTGTPPTYTVYKVPSGGSSSTSNIIWNAPFKTNPDSFTMSGLNTGLKAGDMIYAMGSVTGINITLTIEEYQ